MSIFPEIANLKMVPRAAGKPSVEVAVASLPNFHCSPVGTVDCIVFLNRSSGKHAELRPYRKEIARHVMQHGLFGLPEKMAVQHQAIERLLEVDVFEMHYTQMDWAVDRLKHLLLEGS